MKLNRIETTIGVLFVLLVSQFCHAQYSISGYIDSKEPNKNVYLSLLAYDELNTMDKNQILFSTKTDSTGYFHFEGNLLDRTDKIYRIHANLNEDTDGFDFTYLSDIRNFRNFIFSNTDTIHFEKSGKLWFSKSNNTNLIDKQWRRLKTFKDRLSNQYINIKNISEKNRSIQKTLQEVKEYSKQQEAHPLTNLLLINSFEASFLKNDYKTDADFYQNLYQELQNTYGSTSYALQFKDQLSRLKITPNEEKINAQKNTIYFLVVLILFLLTTNTILYSKNKQLKKVRHQNEAVHLTKQEEKVAELINLGKTNKEIAAELYVSLSTVKTHVRNIFAKFDVNSREEFKEKNKNQPRD